MAVITDVLIEATELLGSDVSFLPILDSAAAKIGLATPITYGDAFRSVANAQDKALARDFTRLVLALRHDERVQGLDLSGMTT